LRTIPTLSKTNQNRILNAKKLMSFDPKQTLSIAGRVSKMLGYKDNHST